MKSLKYFFLSPAYTMQREVMSRKLDGHPRARGGAERSRGSTERRQGLLPTILRINKKVSFGILPGGGTLEVLSIAMQKLE